MTIPVLINRVGHRVGEHASPLYAPRVCDACYLKSIKTIINLTQPDEMVQIV